MWQRVYFSLCSSAFIPHQSLLLNFVCHNFPIPQSFVILNWNLPNLWHWCCLCQESEDGFPLGSGSTLSKVRPKCRKHFLCSFILVVVYLRYYRTINSSILTGCKRTSGQANDRRCTSWCRCWAITRTSGGLVSVRAVSEMPTTSYKMNNRDDNNIFSKVFYQMTLLILTGKWCLG